MPVFVAIILSTFAISLVSFVGAVTLFFKEKLVEKALMVFVAFSAGALLATSFFDLLPESINLAGAQEISLMTIFLFLILGFCLFFVLEQFIGWHHHHSVSHPEMKSFSYLILVSDGIHNFIDGIIVGGAFMVAIPVGITASLAVFFHEIPHELGNFGVLVYGGFGKRKALLYNFASAGFAILGGVVGFLAAEILSAKIMFLLPFAAGSFIYIAASDLIPQVKEEENLKKSLVHFAAFLTGIIIIVILGMLINE
jgi:zinc and cadmium transporter